MPERFRSIRVLVSFLVLGLTALSMGCAPGGPQATTSLQSLINKQSGKDKKVEELNQQIFASVSRTPQYQNYILGQGDLIQIKVFETEKLNTQARIGARGYVTLPLLGQVKVANMSAQEAEKKIEDLYQEKYLQDPHVTIFVKEQLGSKISVLGEVKEPGTYDYFARQRLLDCLAMAGGLNKEAGRTAQIRRFVEKEENTSKYIVNLNELIKEGRTELNLTIKGGDVIFVPEAGTVYVDGAVNSPGNYPINKDMSVQEAIIAAGGFSQVAAQDRIKLARVTKEGTRKVVKLDATSAKNRKLQNVQVQDRDVIFVETSTMEALMYGLRLNIGGRLLGVGYNPAQTR